MSGTLNTIHNNVSFALNLHYAAMARLQEQAYTGTRINRASDNPSDAYRILGLDSQKRELGNYMDNISNASNILQLSSTILSDMLSAVADTKVSLTQIFSGTYDEGGRQRLVGQINDTLDQMVSLANTKHLGQYIFGGSNTGTAPYTVQRTNGEITSVTYQGSSQQRNIEIAPGVISNAYQVGEDVFGSNDRAAVEFLGSTGAAAGSGTSSVKGNTWLTVTDLGAGNYGLSIDDGATTVNIAVAVGGGADIANIPVTNAAGEVLYVDATNITGAGVEPVRSPGTFDLFNTLISIRDLLENNKNLSETDLKVSRDKLSESLDEVRNILVGKTTSIGSLIGFTEDLKNSLENIKFDTEAEAAMLEEVDIAQVAIDLARRETLYQMSLSVAGKLMSISLLDFIR